MLIAFYAPMKPLDDPVPSGDRQMGRLVVRALEEAGHRVRIASTLRSWSRHGGDEQDTIRDQGEAEVRRLEAAFRSGPDCPDLWVTYHLYHKAPDHIGPAVSKALGIPYVVIEASRALKRRTGPWASGFAAADRALADASAVVAMHAEDADGLRSVVADNRLFRLAPFIDTALFDPLQSTTGAKSNGADALGQRGRCGGTRLVTVAMMRRGDKERSYRVLAEALARLEDADWTLTIAGDGEARDDLVQLFPKQRTTWLGAVAPNALRDVYAMGDVFAWPAINEAFGLVFLEAQAMGLPVVAGRTGGVPDVVADGVTGHLAPEGDAAAFADALAGLMANPDEIRQFGAAARDLITKHHTIAAGRRCLESVLAYAVAGSRP